MQTCSMRKARAQFSKLVDCALAGEPQRVTRYGRDAVVIVSEVQWATRQKSDANLGELPGPLRRRNTASAPRTLSGPRRPAIRL